MNDKVFIYEYLDRYYKVKTDGSGYVLISKETGRAMQETEFMGFFIKVFTNYNIGKDSTAFAVYTEWFNERKREQTKSVEEYLSDCTVLLKRYGWQAIKPSGELIDIVALAKHFENEYSQQFLTHYFGEWFSHKCVMNQNE